MIGEVGRGRPCLVLFGHMDTVPGELPVRLRGGRLSGRGAVDAKSSLAAMILGSAKVAKLGLPSKIIVAALVGEESSGAGIRQVIRNGVKGDYAIFGEPSGLSNITVAYRGALSLTLTVKTKGGHSSSPWLSENAVDRAMQIWQAIKDYCRDSEDVGSRFNSLSCSLTKLSAGSDANQIPSHCVANLDIRIPLRLKTSKVRRDLESIVRRSALGVNGLVAQLNVRDSIEPYESGKDTRLVGAFAHAIRAMIGQRPVLVKKTGSSDMNIYARRFKMPAIAYGPGDSRLDHTNQESISISEYLASIGVYETALKRLVGLS